MASIDQGYQSMGSIQPQGAQLGKCREGGVFGGLWEERTQAIVGGSGNIKAGFRSK